MKNIKKCFVFVVALVCGYFVSNVTIPLKSQLPRKRYVYSGKFYSDTLSDVYGRESMLTSIYSKRGFVIVEDYIMASKIAYVILKGNMSKTYFDRYKTFELYLVNKDIWTVYNDSIKDPVLMFTKNDCKVIHIKSDEESN